MMDIKEFVDFGYLQEVNRQFFHPLGLALVYEISEEGKYSLYGIQDSRNDPEGIIYEIEGEDDLNDMKSKRSSVKEEQIRRSQIRLEVFGSNTQQF